jgi:hypothetical protein
MTALEQVIFVALTLVGPKWETSRPMIIVQAASLDVLRFAVTLRTLTRCGCNSTVSGALRERELHDYAINSPDYNRHPQLAHVSSRLPSP